MIGIEETTDMAIFAARLGNAIDNTLADGKVTISDATNLFGVLSASKAAFENSAQIPTEVKDLDADEINTLNYAFANELDLHNDFIEGLAEEGVRLTLQLIAFASRIGKAKSQTAEQNAY